MKTKVCFYEEPEKEVKEREKEVDYLLSVLMDKMNSRRKKLQYSDIEDIKQILRYCLIRNSIIGNKN